MNTDSPIEHYAQRRQFFDERVPALVQECLRTEGARNVLEAGCGDGSLVHALSTSGLLEGRDFRACDLSKERVRRVHEATGVESFVDDVETLEHVDDGSVDVFLSSMVIEHVDDGKMANAIARVTRPGSRVYLSTVFKRWYGVYFHRAPCGWALDPTHLREYTSDAELLSKFDRAQFRLVRSDKSKLAYAVVDPILRLVGATSAAASEAPLLKRLRDVRVPVPGYFTWELLFERV